MLSKDILKILNDNPDLPVYAYVDAELCGDCYGYWIGDLNKAVIKSYAKVKPWGWSVDTDIVYDDELGDYEDYLYEIEYAKLSDEDAEEAVKKEINSLKFTKAIFIYVESPNY